MPSKSELWKLVNRVTGKVYYENLLRKDGSKLLLSKKKYRDKLGNYKIMENKVLVLQNYVFQTHPSMGNIWSLL